MPFATLLLSISMATSLVCFERFLVLGEFCAGMARIGDAGAIRTVGQLSARVGKAPEDGRTPRRFATGHALKVTLASWSEPVLSALPGAAGCGMLRHCPGL